MSEEECCPKFNPLPWDEKIVQWKNKRFIKDKVSTLFYIPTNFGKVMTRLVETVDRADANFQDGLCLSEHVSKWKMSLFLAVDKEIPGVENVSLSGKFFCKVYEGPFKDTGKWSKDFEEHVKNEKLKINKQYMWYTTCPKCAKKHGKNYVVILGEMAN